MDSQWLKTQFELNPDKTKAGLAKIIGLEPPAISKILKGTRQIKAHEYMQMRIYFGLPVDGENSLNNNQDTYMIKPLASEQNLSDTLDTTKDNWVIPADVLSQKTDAAPESIKIFTVNEALMEPDFKKGAQVLVDITDQKPSPPGAFVISDGFGQLVRQCEFIPGSSPAKVKISAHNKSFEAQTLNENDFEIIGRVIAKLQWL